MERNKFVLILLTYLVLSPFFTHVWDSYTLLTSMELFLQNENVYAYYANQSILMQRKAGIPYYLEGFTYLPNMLLFYLPFYLIYKMIYQLKPFEIPYAVLHLLDLKVSETVYSYNILIKLPLLIAFIALLKMNKEIWKNKIALIYAIFIAFVLGMSEILVALFLFLTYLAIKKKNVYLAGVFYGLSLFKIYPVIFLPWLLIYLYKQGNSLFVKRFFVTMILVNLYSAFYILQDFQSFVFSSIYLQSNRIAGGITPVNVLWIIPDYLFNYQVSKFYSTLFPIFYVIFVYYLWKNRNLIKLEEGLIIIALIFLLTFKVVNEQYFLSFLPFFVLYDQKFAKRVSMILLIFALIRMTPVYFSSPTLYLTLENYQSFISDYYSIMMMPYVNLALKLSLFFLGCVFWIFIIAKIAEIYKKNVVNFSYKSRSKVN